MEWENGSKQFRNSRGITAVGLFLFFGAVMAGLAGTTLLWRGTQLDRVWTLNPRAYSELAPLGSKVGILFLLLSLTLFLAGLGWFRRRLWGWRLAVALIATQVAANGLNLVLGRIVEGMIGLVIAGALLIYLLRPAVKRRFLAT